MTVADVRGKAVLVVGGTRGIGRAIAERLAEHGAEVGVTRDGDRVTIAIRDTGPGIDPAILSDVTKPFVRGEASRNADTGGTGLGLSIAHGIVRDHGGELTLENRDGGGLLARIVLPASDLAVDQDGDAAL